MFDWIRKLLANAKERAALLEVLEQQAHTAKEQLNEALLLAVTASNPATKVLSLEVAKSKFAELQAIAAEHPRMRLTNEEEIAETIKLMGLEFTRSGYYEESVSAHVNFSQRAIDLLR